jgi:hypothetical protein
VLGTDVNRRHNNLEGIGIEHSFTVLVDCWGVGWSCTTGRAELLLRVFPKRERERRRDPRAGA